MATKPKAVETESDLPDIDMSTGEPVIDTAAVLHLLIEAIAIGGSYNDRQHALLQQARVLMGETLPEPPVRSTFVPDEGGSFVEQPHVTDKDGNVHHFG